MIREPVVAGQFYPGTSATLSKALETLVDKKQAKEDAIGVVSPHAGYVYSGRVAGSVFSSINAKDTYIIMGPNHTGMGESFGLSASLAWKTPLGEVKINKKLAGAILKNSRYIKEDEASNLHEHSIEVQLPFLQFLQKDFKFVPIVISYAALDIYTQIGRSIAAAVKELELQNSVTIVASSDMTHHESQEEAKRKDSIAIDAILKLDEVRLVESVTDLGISMCGYGPTAVMIAAAKDLGAKRARLIDYRTSGDASGDYSSVVGYAGIIIS